jgi:spectinomycin phosphotransferase
MPKYNFTYKTMLTKPDVSDEFIISRLQEEYKLRVASLTFLPLGADEGSVVYRVVTEDETTCFLKLRKGFNEIIVTVPLFLKSQSVQEIIAPFETKSKQGWADFGNYKMILYPFIEGKDGFSMELSDHHRRTLGTALKAIHTVQVSSELKRHIPQETFLPQWREKLKLFQVQVENNSFDEPTAKKLAKFMKSKWSEIIRLIKRTEELAV